MKYSKKQLQDLAEGCFRSSPLEEVFYASENGTFLNQVQYNNLPDAAKKDYEEFRNPAFEKPKAEGKAKKVVATTEGESNEGEGDGAGEGDGTGEDEGAETPAKSKAKATPAKRGQARTAKS